MRRPLLIFIVWGILILLTAGCSSEEQPPPPEKPKVVKKSIAKPSAEPVKPIPVRTEEKAKSQESPQPQIAAKATEAAKPEVGAKVEKVPGAGAEKGSQEKPAAETRTKPEEKSKPQPVVKAEEKPKPEPVPKPEGMDSPEVRAKAEAKQARVEPTPKAPAREPVEKAAKKEEVKEFYTVKKGDSLAKVAGREDVYGDPLKWPVIYRMNMDALAGLPATEKLPDTELPGGMKLRIMRPEEMNRNLEKRTGHLWVVNVISAATLAEIMPAVTGAIRNGYTVYLSTARVNDKDWMRVRVGFFVDRARAEAEGKKIMEILNFRDSWTTRLGKNEFAEFARY